MLAVVLIWGINFPLVKAALREFDTLAFAGVRFILVVVCMVLLAWWREGDLRPEPGDFWKLMGLGLLGNATYQLSFILGLARTTASNASLIVAMSPIFVALTALWLGERIQRWAWLGIVLSFAGMALVIQGGVGAHLGGDHLAGDLITLVGAIAWGSYTALLRPFLKQYSPLKLNALCMLLGTFPIFIAAAPAIVSADWSRVSLGAWAILIYSAIFSVVVAYSVWNWAVMRVGSARTAVYSNLVPIVALGSSSLLLGERMAPLQFVGAAIVISGIILTRKK